MYVPVRNVCNGAFASNKIGCTRILEMLLKYSIQPLDLVLISSGSIFIVLRCVPNELVRMSADRASYYI